MKKIYQVELNELKKYPNQRLSLLNNENITITYVVRPDLKPELAEIIRIDYDDFKEEVNDDRD